MASLHPCHASMVVLYVAVDILKQMTELRSGRCIDILGNISADHDRDRDLVTECLSIVIHLTDIMGRISVKDFSNKPTNLFCLSSLCRSPVDQVLSFAFVGR